MQPLSKFKKTEIGEIPIDWKILSVKDVAMRIQSGIWGEEASDDKNIYPVLRSTDILHDGKIILENVAIRKILPSKIQDHKLNEGDILIVSSSGSSHLLGRTAYFVKPNNDQIYLFSNFLIRIIPSPKETLSKFLYYLLNSHYYHIPLQKLQETTSGLRNFSKSQLVTISLPFPSLKEQKKIVSILSNVAKLIQKTEQIIKQTQRLKKGLMQRLLTKGIRHTKYKKENFGGQITQCIPESWVVYKLHELSLAGTQNGYALSIEEYGQGIPIVGMTDLFANDILEITNLKEVKSNQNLQKFFIKSGDLLFGRRSLTVEGSGKCVLSQEISQPVIFESSIIRLTPDITKVLPRFLFYMLNSPFGRRVMSRIIQVVAVSGITGSDLKEIKIPISPNITEQKKIIGIISTIDSQLNLLHKYLSKYQRIKNGLMQQLITGKIRVKV